MKAKRLFCEANWSKQSLRSLLFLICFAGFSVLKVDAQDQNKFFFYNGGKISTPDETTICVDDTPDPINVDLNGAYGYHKKWVITDYDNNILALPAGPPFDFNGAGPGICKIWHISYLYVVHLDVGNNLNQLYGWYDLSNSIAVTRNQPEGGILEGGPFEFTVGDGEADNIPEGAITLTGNTGSNSQWVVTDSEGNILGLPESPYMVNFDVAGAGTCLVWHLSFEDGLEGAMMGNNASELVGCYNLSNPIEVIRTEEAVCDVNGGKLDGGPFEFCAGDGEADNIPEGAIVLSENTGSNSQWVVTDSEGNILGLPESPYMVNFDAAGAGTCLVWHLSFEDGLEGAMMGNNASELVGCYSLSNPIEVIRNQPEGGTLEGGPFEFCAGDGEADSIPEGAITLSGNTGTNSQWVVTDSEGNILGLPESPYMVNFDGAGAGMCLVWHLSFEDGLEGAMMGNNASELVGCYSLSNPIEVIRNQPEGGTLEGGPFEFCAGDGEADNIPEGAITLSGNTGSNSQWVVTDSEGNILGLPESPYMVNFDVAGAGTCLVWHLSFEDGLEGAAMGNNASELVGCYSLSNPIEVIRNQPEGGTLEGGPFEFCAGDGEADNIPEDAITLSGNTGSNSQWVVTDSEGNILGLPESPYMVNFDVAGAGTCLVWHLSFEDGLEGAMMGNNASELVGCYSLSNPISVIRNQPEGGTLEGGPFEFTVGDGVADNIPEGAITLTGNTGSNSQWVVTDSEGNILGLPESPYMVNFDVAGAGTCLVWHLSFEDGLEGAMMGNNASELVGCYNLSNPIEVIRTEEAVCDVNGGKLDGGPFEFCAGDGEADSIPEGAIVLSENTGSNSQWVVTDSEGNILGLPESPYMVNFDVAGAGTCLVWHLSFEDGLEGAMMGNNASELVGCYSLSNPISVVRNQPEGGTLEGGPFEFTVGDGVADNIPEGAITLSGNTGSNSQWVVTDSEGNILGLPESPYMVNFDVAGAGTCLVWHLSFEDGLEGAMMGNNASELQGCYSLSNPIEVIRTEEEDCKVNGGHLSSDTFYVFCVGDDEPDYALGINLEDNDGENSQWVVTDLHGNILGLPETPEEVNFDVAGQGICLIWHLSFDTIDGAAMGSNAFSDLSGCYDLSNPIPVFRFDAGGVLCELFSYSKSEDQIEISMYPNPATEKVSLDMSKLEEKMVNVKIYNQSSLEVFNRDVELNNFNKKSTQVDVTNLSKGFYLVSITNEKGEVKAVKRLIIK